MQLLVIAGCVVVVGLVGRNALVPDADWEARELPGPPKPVIAPDSSRYQAPIDTPPRGRGGRRRASSGSRQLPASQPDTQNDSAGVDSLESPVVAPGPDYAGSGRGSNEPPGFRRISERGFNRRVEDGWWDRRGPNFLILEEPGTPVSSPSFGRAMYPPGMKGGIAPIMENRELDGEHRAVYVSFWVRFSSNWVGHRSGSNKILHFWIAGQNKVVFKATGVGAGPLRVQVHLQGVNHRPGSYDLRPNGMADGRITRGRWHHMEVLVRANTGGNSDGQIEWWLDGSKVGSYYDVPIVRANHEHSWNKVSWNPTWGGVGGNLPSAQSMDMDHFYLSAQ